MRRRLHRVLPWVVLLCAGGCVQSGASTVGEGSGRTANAGDVVPDAGLDPKETPVPSPGGANHGTYLRPNTEDTDGTPAYVHVTLADMPLVVAMGTPRIGALDGSTRDARQAAVEGILLWEEALGAAIPWFRIEIVEEDPAASVQVRWKRRLAGPYAGFGGIGYRVSGSGLRVGGQMTLTMQPGLPASAEPLRLEELRLLVAHEFGHVLGLRHCLDCDSAMNYAWETRDRIFVTETDVRTFRALLDQPNGTRVDGRLLEALRVRHGSD